MTPSLDMFKKIKSLFIVEDPNATNADESNIADEQKVSNTVINAPSDNGPAVTVTSGNVKPDPKFSEMLLKAIEANNLEGFDYLEYKTSLKSVEAVIPDEGMRYKSAFEMAKTMGLTKDKLIQSATHYLNVLATEDKKFKDALENQKSKQIQGRTDQIQSYEKGISDKEQQIKKLNEEIEAAKKQLDTFKSEINDAAAKIEITTQQFLSSYKMVYSQVANDIEKIKNNL